MVDVEISSCSDSESSNQSEKNEDSKEEESKEHSDGKCEKCSGNEILISDDGLFNLMMLQQMLQQEFDLKADEAQDGLIEIEMYQKNLSKTCCDSRYRLILTDINMPNLDGLEAAVQVLEICQKAKQRDPSVR